MSAMTDSVTCGGRSAGGRLGRSAHDGRRGRREGRRLRDRARRRDRAAVRGGLGPWDRNRRPVHGERLITADAHPCCWLAVTPGNERARRFYERERWHDAGGFEYDADTGHGGTVVVPCRRYEKSSRLTEGRA